jgi:transposase
MESNNQIVPLYRLLTKKGYDVSVSHPKKTRYIAEAKIKSDRIDSKAIAELVRLDALPQAYMPDQETAMLREKIRRRAFLVRERVRLRTKIKSILTYEGIKTPIEHGLFTEKGIEWLHSLTLEPVESYLRIINPLDDEIKHLSKHLKELAEDDEDVRLLMTIPGVGYYTALLVISEIGDINRFSDGDKLRSYAGLVPSTHASGGTVRHGSITKEGSRWLRWVMVEAAMTHVHKYDSAITKAYHRIAERRGKQVATVAAARKLLMCCYAVLKNRHPYYDHS